jgi:hypothetical protein
MLPIWYLLNNQGMHTPPRNTENITDLRLNSHDLQPAHVKENRMSKPVVKEEAAQQETVKNGVSRLFLGIALLLLLMNLGARIGPAQAQIPVANPDLPDLPTQHLFAEVANPGQQGKGLTIQEIQRSLRAGAMTQQTQQIGPQPLAAWSRIYVQALTENGWDIFSIRMDGHDPIRLTNSPGGNIQPRLSPDGREVLFVSGRDGNSEIYKVAADGSSPAQRLTNHSGPDSWPTWSADGSQIVFAAARVGQFTLHMMNADGSNQREIYRDGWGHAVMPIWGAWPGGIFFVRYGVTGEASVWRFYVDSGHAEQVSDEFKGVQRIQRFSHQNNTHYLLLEADFARNGGQQIGLLCMSTPSICGDRSVLVLQDGGSMMNYFIGPTPPVRDPATQQTSMLISQAHFGLVDGQTVLTNLEMKRWYFSEGMDITHEESVGNFAIVTEWRAEDREPPVLQLAPLPEWSVLEYPNHQLSFSGYDPGGSGIVLAEIAYFQGEWFTFTPINYQNFQGSSVVVPVPNTDNGHLSLRIRGRDHAGNWSEWSKPVTSKAIGGYIYPQVMDVLGYPIPEAILESAMWWQDQLRSDSLGMARGILRGGGHFEQTLSADHPGYGNYRLYRATSNTGQMDEPASRIILPPKSNYFKNGNFTTNNLADDWAMVGSALGVNLDPNGDGSYSLRIGRPRGMGASHTGVQATIDLSKDLPNPVLNFIISPNINAAYGDRFSVILHHDEGEEELLSLTESEMPEVLSSLHNGWAMYSFTQDLTPWTGQQIKLTLEMHSGDPAQSIYSSVTLHHISLGSWTTPVIHSVSIAPTSAITQTLAQSRGLEPGEPFSVTVEGLNFGEGVQVFLGDVDVSDRIVRQEREGIDLLITAGLPVGIHALRIANSDGTVAIFPSAVAVGQQRFLPHVVR